MHEVLNYAISAVVATIVTFLVWFFVFRRKRFKIPFYGGRIEDDTVD